MCHNCACCLLLFSLAAFNFARVLCVVVSSLFCLLSLPPVSLCLSLSLSLFFSFLSLSLVFVFPLSLSLSLSLSGSLLLSLPYLAQMLLLVFHPSSGLVDEQFLELPMRTPFGIFV